jgi:hypothetical protein
MYYTPETLSNHVFEDLRKPKAPNSIILILKEQAREESFLYLSTHTNLVLLLTNTHYKPSLCCLELIFAGSLIHPPLGALRNVTS